MDISRPVIEKPRFIEVEKFVESRANSIAQLLKAIDNESLVSGEVTKGPRTAAQRLPRHMRRRAMAYEVRRFPKGMREFAASHIVSKHRKKPPSRFARRKPCNILESYSRRQMSNGKWTETHIWHAKRFRMIRRWGFKIADRSYQRGFRSIIRDSKRKCVIRDLSHLTCFIMKGKNVEQLMDCFCDRRSGIRFSDKKAQRCNKEYSIQLYTPGEFPNGYIGPARFSWITYEPCETSALCVWIHPSSKNQFKNLVMKYFGVENCEKGENSEYSEKLVAENISVEIYESSFNRFRLYGPLASSKLEKAVRLAVNEEYRNHNSLWSRLAKLKDDVPNGTIISAFIEDPRTCFDRKKNNSSKYEEIETDLDVYLPSTSFWDSNFRLSCRNSRLTNAQFHKLNSEKIGGVKETETKIPIQIIFRTSNHSILDGIEVLIPMTFGKDLWIALQRQDCRASGVRDEKAAHLEATRMCFPFHDIDSEAGRMEEKAEKDEQLKKYESRPFNRRCQYWEALSVKYPFEYKWEELVSNWIGKQCEALVCRDNAHLVRLSSILNGKGIADDLSEDEYLIPVKLEFIGRGRPAKFGVICIPDTNDLQDLRRNRNSCIIQKPRKVQKEEEGGMEEEGERSGIKLQGFVSLDAASHEKAISLKALFEPIARLEDKKVKRKILNRKKKESAKRRKMRVGGEVEEGRMEEVEYRNSASREILGRVMSGGASILGGRGVALGYICAAGINRIAQNFGNGKSIVLVRNSTSKYYHPAKVTILRGHIEL